MRKALALLKGTYGLAVVCPRLPDVVIGARLGSPLVLGIGEEENFLASDPGALVGKADRVVYLQDHQLCVLTPDDWQILDQEKMRVEASIEAIDWEAADSDKGVFEHYMLKEIYEQPEALENALRGRLSDADASAHFGGLNLDAQQLRRAERIILTACGTSYHAALVGEYLFEEFARMPVEVEYATEFRYRNPPLDRNTIVLAITQSGETADTLAAVRESKRKGHPTLALCNVVGSTIAREADGGVYLHAGPEIGVASTKAFTNQVAVLAMLALYLGRMRHLSSMQGTQMIRELRAIPDAVRRTLSLPRRGQAHRRALLPLQQLPLPRPAVPLPGGAGRGAEAEGDQLYPRRGLSRRGDEARADRPGGPADAVGVSAAARADVRQGDEQPGGGQGARRAGDRHGLRGRRGRGCTGRRGDLRAGGGRYLQPLVSVVPLQLLAYHIALLRGCDVDKPRNLAKSVTVE